MLVINVFYTCKPGKREEFLEMAEREGVRVGSLEEEGNRAYRYYRSVADENALFLYEEWKDVEAHALHRTMPHYQRLQECQGEYLELDKTVVNKYITED
ncbi:MAG: antibiotic biosynthesis monooxygenase [Mogibacterium sp.]|nr:antibiotic biosynthesis monooxygenase [Mogibacterium sp.]MBR2541241.1 antibiotic biosynthesis monooxygenase [Mogibacterium sp.]